MATQSRIKIDHQDGEVFSNTFPDFDWARSNRTKLLAEYGPGVVLVYEKRVIGFGQTLNEAILDADHRLSNEIQEVTPIIFLLSDRGFPLRFRPGTTSTAQTDG